MKKFKVGDKVTGAIKNQAFYRATAIITKVRYSNHYKQDVYTLISEGSSTPHPAPWKATELKLLHSKTRDLAKRLLK